MDVPSSHRSVLALVLLIRIVGVAGFVGLLVASQVVRGAEDACRVAALVWFAVFGIVYVVVGARAPGGGRRWP
jgi:hypothetical protein